jgi:hypothetical protein
MRPEEWIPLEPGDVDEQAMIVTIRRTYTEGKGLSSSSERPAARFARSRCQKRQSPCTAHNDKGTSTRRWCSPRHAAATSTSETGAAETGSPHSRRPALSSAAQTRSHANRSRAILDAIWENYLDANWTQIQNAIPTASLENPQIRLNQAANSEAL